MIIDCKKWRSIHPCVRKTYMKPRIKGFLDLFLLAPVSCIALLTVNALAQTSCAPPPSGLVSWWRAEGNAADSVDNNGGVLLNGAGFTNGVVGQAFLFDGINDHVRIADRANLRVTNGLTIEAWINP